MDEQYSPNYTEFVYEKKAEGTLRAAKVLLIFAYLVFVIAYFLVCYITRFIPVFALCPVFTWILVFFTWRCVSFDVYYTFNHGDMEFGKVQRRKRASRRRPKLKVNVRSAILIAPYSEAITTDEYRSATKKYDFSSCSASQDRLVAVFRDTDTIAVIFEKTPAVISLLRSYAKHATSRIV